MQLLIGRDPVAQIAFDPITDDLVGRLHARIAHDAETGYFLLHDLDARNGTFLNRQRVLGARRLQSGDIIQVGAGGPELEFRLHAARSDEVHPGDDPATIGRERA